MPPSRQLRPPVSYRPAHRPSPRPLKHVRYAMETDMTVCIAAAAMAFSDDPSIVLCSDCRLEDALSGADTGRKIQFSDSGWCYLMAGSLSRAKELVAIYRSSLAPAWDCKDEAEAVQMLRRGPEILKQRLVEEYLGTKWAINLEDFKLNGRKRFPSDLYNRINLDIEQINLGCELVMACFLETQPLIFLIDQSGQVHPQSGFATIGSGFSIAQASMHQRGYRHDFSVEKAMYCAYEAKRLAQISPGVGSKTEMGVIFGPYDKEKSGGFREFGIVGSGGFEYLETQFKRFGLQEFNSPESLDRKVMFSVLA